MPFDIISYIMGQKTSSSTSEGEIIDISEAFTQDQANIGYDYAQCYAFYNKKEQTIKFGGYVISENYSQNVEDPENIGNFVLGTKTLAELSNFLPYQTPGVNVTWGGKEQSIEGEGFEIDGKQALDSNKTSILYATPISGPEVEICFTGEVIEYSK